MVATLSLTEPKTSWILFQLANKNLSFTLSGPHPYNQAWAQAVLAQNFVQITGPLTFTLHIQHPNSALAYVLATIWGTPVVAPIMVMQRDFNLWNQSSNSYSLPYSKLTGGNESEMIYRYLLDEVATCNSGITPSGCAATYLDGSYDGSNAGTGPYTIQSVGKSTNNIILLANPNYWGGPYQFMGGNKIIPQIKTIIIKYVPSVNTRELDLKNAAESGQAMTVDLPNDHLYDFANRSQWLNDNTFGSVVPGVTLYGPYGGFNTLFDNFGTNVSNPQTASFYQFQPFADLRFRLAFSDAVNLTDVNVNINNKMGQIATSGVPPGLPPTGAFNSSITPRYSYNLTAVQDLLLSAMESPITHLNFVNGTAAPPGLFNNTFGCSAQNLESNGGRCKTPIPQSIPLTDVVGDISANEAILTQIASAVNNVSAAYNMGLTVSVIPLPIGQFTY